MILHILLILIIIIVYKNYDKIPLKEDHINRNKYNVFPDGKLIYVKDNTYVDNNGIIWIRRFFLNSIFHNPFEYYVFETYDSNKTSSSEVEILKTDFDNNNQNFKPPSYNYYSSFNHPISHLFADVIPIMIYLRPEYTVYN